MTPTELKRRIREKLGCPELFTRKPLPDHCLPWPTLRDPEPKHRLRIVRDRQGRPYTAAVSTRPLAKITVKGETFYVHRKIYELTHPNTSPFRAVQICNTPFCVHPGHWAFTPIYPPTEPELEPPQEEPWSIEDAIGLVDLYLAEYPHPPLDLNHNYLIDIPPHLVTQALTLANKEHLIP